MSLLELNQSISQYRGPGVWHSGGLKATAFEEEEVWVDETVTEGGRRFMAAPRKEEVDATRHRQEKREATRMGKLLFYTEALNLRSDTHWPS